MNRLDQIRTQGLAWDVSDPRQRAILHCLLVQAGMHPVPGNEEFDVVEAKADPEGLYIKFGDSGAEYILSTHVVMMRPNKRVKVRKVRGG